MMVQNISFADDRRLTKQVPELLAAGYDVTVVTRGAPDHAAWYGIEGLELVEYPPPRDGSSTFTHLREYATSVLRQIPTLARVHRRHPIDVMHLCQPPDLYFPVAKVFHRLGIPVLLDQRDLMPETLQQRYTNPPRAALSLLHWLERRTQASVDHSLTVNGYLRRRLIEAGGHPDSVSVVYNGPVLARVDEGAAAPRPHRDQPHVVVWAGKMGRQDRVDQVIRLAHKVVHEHGRRDCAFWMIGNGEVQPELEALTDELGVRDRVSFLGWLSEVELYGLLRAADIGLDTSLQPEVTPVKALDYMATGLPVLAFDVEETHRLVEGCGVLATPGDLDAMAAALLQLLDAETERRALGESGRERINNRLAWERQSEVYLGVVGRLAGRTPARRAARVSIPG